MARLGIFSQEEQRLFNSPPAFNSIERRRYFAFPNGILERAKKLDKPRNRVYFLLMYGYFNATNKFYLGKFHQKDILYVAGKLNIPGGALNQVRRRYGSRDHRVLPDVGGHRSVGRLLLVDAPHLEPARRLAHGTAGIGTNAARYLARSPPCRWRD